MNPFARQLLGWQAGDEQKRAAALVLEVKGDFCHDIRQILVEAGRGQDYIELGMDARSQWNPLSAWWLDSYSLAYTVSSLLNQLFGKGKEPFWQQAYTNLVRWIIELYRVFPERWVTLQQVYRCAIDPELFAAKIKEAEKLSDDLNTGTVFMAKDTYEAQVINLAEWNWIDAPETQDVSGPCPSPRTTPLSSLACSLSRLSSRSGSSTVCATRSAAYYTRLLSPAWDSFLCRAYLAPSSSSGSAPAEIPSRLPS